MFGESAHLEREGTKGVRMCVKIEQHGWCEWCLSSREKVELAGGKRRDQLRCMVKLTWKWRREKQEIGGWVRETVRRLTEGLQDS